MTRDETRDPAWRERPRPTRWPWRPGAKHMPPRTHFSTGTIHTMDQQTTELFATSAAGTVTPRGTQAVPGFELKRDDQGSLFAETCIPLGFERRELRIKTRKAYRGGVQSSAMVVQVSVDQRSFTHVMGFGGGGDFSVELARDPKARTTEKTVRALHAAALLGVDDVLAKARVHYSKPMAPAADGGPAPAWGLA